MFGILENLTKAAVSVAVSPLAAVVDTVRLPHDALEDDGPYQNTRKALNNAVENIQKAMKP